MLIAAVDKMRIIDFRRTLRHQSGDDQRRACAQVGRLDRRAMQLRNALDDRRLFINAHTRTHALHLGEVAEAGFKYILYNSGCADCRAEQRAHRLLQVGREARINLRFKRNGSVIAD